MSTPRIRNGDRDVVVRRRSLKGADLLRDSELLGGDLTYVVCRSLRHKYFLPSSYPFVNTPNF